MIEVVNNMPFKDSKEGNPHHNDDACYKCEKCGSHLAEPLGDTEQLSSNFLEDAINSLKRNLPREDSPKHLLIPTPKYVLTKRYRGKGRPRKSDYDYVDLIKIAKEIINNNDLTNK